MNDEQAAEDSQVLIDMMQRISGHEPKLYNAGTIGFGNYHYKYDIGREATQPLYVSILKKIGSPST